MYIHMLGDPWRPGDTIIGESNLRCQLGKIRFPKHQKLPFCLVPSKWSHYRQKYVQEWIFKNVRLFGRWKECDQLVDAWNQSRSSGYGDIFIDIGANIGACTVQFLAQTNANVVAIEPNPNNLFYLTHTLNRLQSTSKEKNLGILRRRVLVVPVAIGDAVKTVSMVMDPLNQGNSAISRSGNIVSGLTPDE